MKEFDNEKHFMKCNICQQMFDMRDLQQVFEHEHDEDLDKPKFPYYGELLSSGQNPEECDATGDAMKNKPMGKPKEK